jgi:hypothetical protein
MDGLGRAFNVIPVASGLYVRLDNAAAVTFVCNGNEAYTVQEAKDAAGTGAQNLVKVDHFYKNKADGTTAWTKVTQAASQTVNPSDATNIVAVFSISANSLSDGYKYVKCTKTTSGLVTALQHDLAVQRVPENLPAVGV